MPSRAKAIAAAIGLALTASALFVIAPILARRVPPLVAFLSAAAIGIPMLVAAQRAWTRFLWARRTEAIRRRAAKAPPDDPEPHVELGVTLSLAGADAEAKLAFQRAREIRPDHPQATVGLAHIAAENGELDQALALFQEASEKDPTLFAAQYGIGGVQFQREQYARAIHAYERALALEPDDAFTLVSLSRCHLCLGDAAKAEEYFARAAGRGLRDPELERLIKASSSES